MRGLTYSLLGTLSFDTPNSDFTCGLNDGSSRNMLPSRRTPYCTWKLLLFRHESPSDRPAISWPASRSRRVSCRVNVAGRPAARSDRELNEKVPSRLFV